MGHGDGRPGTPAPDSGGGGGQETKATFSGGIVLVGIISFVLGVIAVAVPYWGLFRPQSGEQAHAFKYSFKDLFCQGFLFIVIGILNIYLPDCVKGEPGNIMNHEFDNHEISFQEIPVSMLSMELLETTRTQDSLDPGTSVNTPVLDTEDCAVLRYDTRWKVRTTILEKGTTTLVLVYKWSLCSGMQFNILQITFER